MKYIYTGSLRGADIADKSYILHSGNEYDLPEDDEKVKTMLRKQELTEVKTSAKKADTGTKEPKGEK